MPKVHTCWGRGFRGWSRRRGRFWPLKEDPAPRRLLLQPPHLSAWEAARATVPGRPAAPALSFAERGLEDRRPLRGVLRRCCDGCGWTTARAPSTGLGPAGDPHQLQEGARWRGREPGGGAPRRPTGAALSSAKQEAGSMRRRKKYRWEGATGTCLSAALWCLERERPGEKPPELTDRTG